MSRRPSDDSLAPTVPGDSFGEGPTRPSGEAGASRAGAPQALAGRYVILRQLGQGGMGAVYCARDEVLGKEVALKQVRAGVGSVGAREVLRREVLLAQRVTHPNVCRIYDLDELDGNLVLKMELVDGETLAERVARGRLDVAEVEAIGRQVAAGLAAAHAQGVVHGDLKPHNVMIERATGRAVLLDFGLARLERSGETSLAGTPEYMPPEQVRGEALDARSDLYALGVILYELLVGALPFPDQRERVLRGDATERPAPDPRATRPEVPQRLARVVRRLMAPARADRFADAATVERALRRRRIGPAIGLALAGGTLLAAASLIALRATAPAHRDAEWRPAVRVHAPVYEENADLPVISPDGRLVAFTSDRDGAGASRIYVAPLAGGPSRPITPREIDAYYPAWSPDGRAILFSDYRHDRVWRISPDGGAATLVAEDAVEGETCGAGLLLRHRAAPGCASCEALGLRDAAGREREVFRTHPGGGIELARCDRDGTQAVVALNDAVGLSTANDLWLIPLDGTPPRRLNDDAHRKNFAPTFAPDGRSVIFSSHRDGHRNLWEQPLPSGTPRRLTFGDGPDTAPDVARDGRTLVYDVDPVTYPVYAVPTDGGPRRKVNELLEDVDFLEATPDGRQLVATARVDGVARVVKIAVDSGEERVLTAGDQARMSDDGREVLFVPSEGAREVRAMPLAGGPSRRVALLPYDMSILTAVVDGVAYMRLKNEDAVEAWRVPVDGSRPPERAAPAPWCDVLPSHGGAWLAIFDCDARHDTRLVRRGAPLDDAHAQAIHAWSWVWDDDGESIVYFDGESVRRRYPADGRDVSLVKLRDASDLAVSPDGKTIYYNTEASHVRREIITNFADRPSH